MEANKISIEGAWLSKTFDITGFTDATLSVDLSSAGSLSSGDYIRGFYKLDGGSEVQWFSITGSSAPVTKTFNGISGGSLQVVIRMRNDNGETWFFDNVTVTGNCATNAGTASVSQTVISSGQTVDLALTGHNGSIQWQQSTDNITFTDIAGGTTTPFSTAQLTGPGVIYFRAKVTNVCASFSNTVTVTVNEAQTFIETDSLHARNKITVGSTIQILGTPMNARNEIFANQPGFSLTGEHLFIQSAISNANTILNSNASNNAGKVGIGAENPFRKLHILENITSATNGNPTGLRIEQFDITTSSSVFWDIATFGGQLRISNLVGGVEGQASIMTLFSEGLSIGKPTFRTNYEGSTRLKLDVAGDGRFGPDNDNYIRIGFNGSAIIDNFSSAGPNNLLINFFSGNDVGIGTGTNKSNLTVGGTINSSGYLLNGVPIGDWTNVSDPSRPNDIYREFGTVGIGFNLDNNDQSAFRLAVCGNIRATEVQINPKVEWCDYVYGDEYVLITIDSLEAFIKKHKHLPGIPSADSIKANGYNIGEMHAMQMEKIEEMSLYLIELKKRMDALAEENRRLKAQISLISK